MELRVEDFSKFIVVGDRILVKPTKPEERTKSGLFLPPGVEQNEKVYTGYVIKCGPGYPIPSSEDEELWKEKDKQIKYIPLQAQEGDLAIYLQKHAYGLEFNREKYVIVPQSAILMLIRDEEMFE